MLLAWRAAFRKSIRLVVQGFDDQALRAFTIAARPQVGEIAKQCLEHITLALGIKAVFFVLAVFGTATMWMAGRARSATPD